MQCKVKEEGRPEIHTIVIGEPQKIILSPRVEVRRVVKHVPAIIDPHHHHQQQQQHHLSSDMEPKIQIITKPYNPGQLPGPRPLSPPQHVHVIKDSRQHYMDDYHHQSEPPTQRKYIVSRQINVISTSGDQVFRAPAVSSTTATTTANNSSAATLMRPPPPPPPPNSHGHGNGTAANGGHKIKTACLNEEPSSSIPDLGKWKKLAGAKTYVWAMFIDWCWWVMHFSVLLVGGWQDGKYLR